MVRNAILYILILGILHALPAGLEDFQSVARGAGAAPDGPISAESSTLSLGQPVLYDTFDDDTRGAMWRAFADDPTNCRVQETNQRLELLATEGANEAWAGYVSNGWRLDPRDDFSMKVSFHYDLLTYPRGTINIGVTPEGDNLRDQHVAIGVGCANLYAYYRMGHQNGWWVDTNATERFSNDGVLYISYNAADDELYIGFAGYGPDYAWQTFTNLLKNEWGGRPLLAWLGGNSSGLAVEPGHVYLDDFLVPSGTVIEAALRGVYRFWSPLTGKHFYTISEAEKEKLLVDYPHVWTYEGVVYHAFSDDWDPASRPVHRFWSHKLSAHFYTIDVSEMNTLMDKFGDVWTYEGVAFYAYPAGNQPAWALPVYRLWSDSKRAHFFTMNEAEMNRLLNEFGHIWTYEGIAWYANE